MSAKQRPLSRKRAAVYARKHPFKWVILADAPYISYEELGAIRRRITSYFDISPQMLGEHAVQPRELPVVTFLQEYFGKFIE